MTKRRLINNLYEKYYEELYLYGTGLYEDDSLVEDAIQEIFAKLMKMEDHQVREINDYGPYLRRSLCNNYLTYFRNRKNIKIVPYSLYIDERTVEQDGAKHIDYIHILQVIEDVLSERDWKVFKLVYIEGLKYAEIEIILELKKSSVGRIIYRAKEKIRKIL